MVCNVLSSSIRHLSSSLKTFIETFQYVPLCCKLIAACLSVKYQQSKITSFTYFRDRKKKKFVREDNNEGKKKKVKTESGHWVKASYKSNLYPFNSLSFGIKFSL